jgi:hypothetical protein
MSASTYLCEKRKSKMKYAKCAYTGQLSSDVYLKSILMTVSTNLESQPDKILLGKHQYHNSHDSCVGFFV